MRRRIWCETLPARELATPPVITLLRRFAIAPIVAVWPHSIDEAAPALVALRESGVAAAVWPMLADADGRWLGAGNADRFTGFVDSIVDVLAPPEIVLDLEPPIEALKLSLASLSVNARVLPPGADADGFLAARRAIAGLVERLHARGTAVSCAIAAPILFDRAWEARLGTPVGEVAWDHVSPMLYTSMIEGWSRGVLGREDAESLLAAASRACADRFGRAAGASLGAVGVGAFGDEPTYRSPAELAADVAIARASGLDDLALFDLGGVLRRPPAEAWLEAFTATPAAPTIPSPTLRARAAIAGMRGAGRAFAALASAGAWARRLAGGGRETP